MDAGTQACVGNVQQGQSRGFVDAAAFCLDDAVFDLVAHAQAVAPANTIGFKDQLDAVGEFDAVKGDGPAFFEANRDLFRLDLDIVAPECHTHDGFDDLDRKSTRLNSSH